MIFRSDGTQHAGPRDGIGDQNTWLWKKPLTADVKVAGGEGFIELGEWRIGDFDGTHFVIGHGSDVSIQDAAFQLD